MAESLKHKHRKAIFAQAFKNSMGNITLACEKTGISRHCYYDMMREGDPEFLKALEEVKEIAIDFVESKLLKAINEGNITAIMYWLNNMGRSRGYGHGFNDTRINIRNEMPHSESEDLTKAIELIHKIRTATRQMKLIKADNLA